MDVDIYLRKSRMEEQSDQAETLRRHKETLYKISDSMGYHVNTVFEEVVSGESLYARPQMLALLEKIEGGGVDAVLCMDIDRLGRGGMRDQGIILDIFRDANTKIITPEHTYDLNDENDEQLTEFKAFFARQEYKQITKRLRRGLRQSISEGCYVSNAPFGYRNVVVDKHPTLEIVDDEAQYVRMIYDMYCAGNGCSSIATALNAIGVKPHRSDRWRRESVNHILRNPVFTGKVVWNRKKHIRKGVKGNDKHITIYQPKELWTICNGLHTAIISEEQFNKVQDIFKFKYISPANDGSTRTPLAGLIRCGTCGNHMQRINMKGGIPYLICVVPGCCAGAKYEYAEEMILSELVKELENLNVEVPKTDDVEKYQSALDNIKIEILKTVKQKDNLHTLLERGDYDIDTYRQRMKVVSDRLTMLSEQEKTAVGMIELHRSRDNTALIENIIHVLDVYLNSDAQGRNLLLKSIIDHVDYFKEKKSKPTDFHMSIYFRHTP